MKFLLFNRQIREILSFDVRHLGLVNLYVTVGGWGLGLPPLWIRH